MVSMVDAEGKLIPEQGAGSRSVNTCPVVIRKGLDIDKIMMHLSDHFNSLELPPRGILLRNRKQHSIWDAVFVKG